MTRTPRRRKLPRDFMTALATSVFAFALASVALAVTLFTGPSRAVLIFAVEGLIVSVFASNVGLAFAVKHGAFRGLSGLFRRTRGVRERPFAGSAVGPVCSVGMAMRLAARLMPAAAGQRWLAEADSILFETAPDQRAEVARSYLVTAPRVIMTAWAGTLTLRAGATGDQASTRRHQDRQDDHHDAGR